MSTQPVDSKRVFTRSLYIRTPMGAVGPYTTKALRRMVRAGVLPARGAVSTDGVHWRRADTIRGLFSPSAASTTRRSSPIGGVAPERPTETPDAEAPTDVDAVGTPAAAPDQPTDPAPSAATSADGELAQPAPADAGARPAPVANASASAAPQGIRVSREMQRRIDQLRERRWVAAVARLPVALSIAAASASGTLGALAWGTGLADGFGWKRLWLFCSLAVPALLALAAILVSGGSRLIGWALGLTEAERRFVALHLPRPALARLHWGSLLANWLYRGDWVCGPDTESPHGYLHVFRTGGAFATIQEEVSFWERLRGSLPYALRPLCRPGSALRQVQPVAILPRWTRGLEDLTDGHALGAVLDHNYEEWAEGFLRRGRERLGLGGDAPVDFFLAFVEVPGDAPVLAVAVYPRAVRAHAAPDAPSDIAAA